MNTQAIVVAKNPSGIDLNDGRLNIPEGMVAEEPISVSVLLSGMEGEQARTLSVEIGAGGKATVIVRYEADAEASGLARSALALRVGEGADLHMIVMSATPETLGRDAMGTASIAEGGVLRWTEAIFDRGRGRYTSMVELSGRNAELDFAGAYAASASTWREHVLSENHLAPATRSRALLKSALRDSAHLLFSGLIRVDPAAPGTDAYLSNRNLLLDDGARAESLPQLKIETDDVACTHGSTTGGPREEELFYLMSRGLDRLTARNMLAIGHLGGVLDRAPEELAVELEAAAALVLGDDSNASQGSSEGAA